ncbi:MAG: single-stranded DNA-binding protein [Bifidobacteriaceae bacterium]|nr:single-stranded DNA-binding protein [Bifidobacteriaceae bacterium]
MNNEITLTVEGWVARSPQKYGREDASWVVFRIGSTAWWWDAQGERRDAPTTWFDVKVSQKDLAENVLLSVKNGDAVIVAGRLSQHYWTDKDGKDRASMQIAARAVGPNLRWGKANWTRRAADAPVLAAGGADGGPRPAAENGYAATVGQPPADPATSPALDGLAGRQPAPIGAAGEGDLDAASISPADYADEAFAMADAALAAERAKVGAAV